MIFRIYEEGRLKVCSKNGRQSNYPEKKVRSTKKFSLFPWRVAD